MVDEVWFSPHSKNYKKSYSASLYHRAKMVELAIQENNGLLINPTCRDSEGNYVYPYDTIYDLYSKAQEKFPEYGFYLLKGSDRLLNYKKDTLVTSIPHLISVREEGFKIDSIVEDFSWLDIKCVRIQTIKGITSTEIREKADSMDNNIPKRVKEYIRETNIHKENK